MACKSKDRPRRGGPLSTPALVLVESAPGRFLPSRVRVAALGLPRPRDGSCAVCTPRALSQPSELHPVMLAALISNKPEFVKLFLENGVRLKEFVTWDTLLSLYQHLEPSCLFRSKLQKVLAEEPERPAGASPMPRVQMHHVAQVLRELLGDFTQPLYPRPRTGDRPRLLLPVPNVKLNVRAGDPPPAALPHPPPRH